MNKKCVAIIGLGAVGQTFAACLAQSDQYGLLISSRQWAKATALADQLENNVQATPLEEAIRAADIVLLTLSDDAIEQQCDALARQGLFKAGATVAHCSGALTSEILCASRALCRTHIASLHPLQTFPSGSHLTTLNNVFCFYEGDPQALDVITPLIGELGMNDVPIQKRAKTLYHASAVMACNYLTVLMDNALSLSDAAGVERTIMWQALRPLINATLANIDSSVENGHIQSALTGPIARGDQATVAKHLNALSDFSPENAVIKQAYSVLGQQAAQLAKQRVKQQPDNATSAEQLDNIIEILQ